MLYLRLSKTAFFCSKRPINKGEKTYGTQQHSCRVSSDLDVGLFRLSAFILNTCSRLYHADHLLVLKEHQQEEFREILLLLCDHLHSHLCSTSRNRISCTGNQFLNGTVSVTLFAQCRQGLRRDRSCR